MPFSVSADEPMEVIVPPLCAVVEVTSNITSLVVRDGGVFVVEVLFLHPVFKTATDMDRMIASRGVFI